VPIVLEIGSVDFAGRLSRQLHRAKYRVQVVARRGEALVVPGADMGSLDSLRTFGRWCVDGRAQCDQWRRDVARSSRSV
jgi:hypothetical protein